MNDVKLVLLALTLSFIVYTVGIELYRARTRKVKVPEVKQTKGWLRLPSGWSKQRGVLTGCVLQTGEVYHWWVTRNGRTIIEGPAKSILHAQNEVDAALTEFQP